ncbi:unnamed protein product [Orchesella dallaii]|uniref:Protein FAM92A1 n=1 Tax=Orchesella dallaii TaxID=48710 RepID=A0ABP1QB45_9HEXA
MAQDTFIRKPAPTDSGETQSQKYKKIFRRIGRFQEYLHEMCNLISNYTVKAAGLRDKNDEVAKCLAKYTKVEDVSTTSKLSMAIVSELVATVGDHQDLAVKRIETLVLPNMASYGRICKCLKADVLDAIAAKSRENIRRKRTKTLKKRTDDPKYKSVVIDAERELERASAETSRLCQLSQEQVIKFEHKRLMDLKESLGSFIKIQIATSAKSLELLSEAYKHIQSIDEDADLDILKNTLNIYDHVSKKKSGMLRRDKSQKSISKSSKNLCSAERKSKDKKQDSDCSTSESWHSDVIRRFEKVMSSNHLDSDHEKKRSKNSSQKHQNEHQYRTNIEDNSKIRKINLVEKSSGLSIHERRSVRKSDHHIEDYANEKMSRDTNNNEIREANQMNRASINNQEDDYDTDSYDPRQAIQIRSSGRRPTTPPRPVTVPTRMSSPEDLSRSYSEEIKFRKKGIKLARNADSSRTYYYSQSEEESARKALRQSTSMNNSAFTSSNGVKRVTFQSGFPRKDVNVCRTDFRVAKPCSDARRIPSDQYEIGRTEALTLHRPIKSSLKKYC